jgi:hypothetical protein
MEYIETIIENKRAHLKFKIELEGDSCIKTISFSQEEQEYDGIKLSDYLTPEQIKQLGE